ncbi:major outer membrane protein [Poseidonibacter sp.]|uniref:major outer membrane protein n=1 Tax=Poseidonibacter sp. TaxID=2321188 RepID=UPI003C76E94B
MKNIIKMSLVAAVAVAGFSSTVAAKPLEESIKDVDFSGSLRYRYTNGESTLEKNEYRLITSVKSKVNDNITAKVTFQGKGATGNASATGVQAGDSDAVNAANIAEAQFIAKFGEATVIVGKQALATPFADGSVDGTGGQQGTGIVAMYPVGPVTLAAGYYLNTDAQSKNNGIGTVDIGGSNITALGALGAAGPVNYAVWYANVSESTLSVNTATNPAAVSNIDAGANAINVNVDGTFGPVSVEFNYAAMDYSATNHGGNQVNADAIDTYSPTQTRVVASFDADVVKLTAGIVSVGQDGGDVTLGDSDASSNFVMENFDAATLKDTTAYYLAVKAPVGPVTLGLEHGRTSDIDGADANGNTSFSETKLSASYAMSKNFTVSGWITETTGDVLNGTDYSKQGLNRIEVKYTF